MPHTVAQLTELGIPLQGKPFRGISYLDQTRRVDADFRSGRGMGVRRTVLHEALPAWKLLAAALVMAGLALNTFWPRVSRLG